MLADLRDARPQAEAEDAQAAAKALDGGKQPPKASAAEKLAAEIASVERRRNGYGVLIKQHAAEVERLRVEQGPAGIAERHRAAAALAKRAAAAFEEGQQHVAAIADLGRVSKWLDTGGSFQLAQGPSEAVRVADPNLRGRITLAEITELLDGFQAAAERATLRAEDPMRWLRDEVQRAMGTRCAARDRQGRCGVTEGLVLALRSDWTRPDKIEASADPAEYMLLCERHLERGPRAAGRGQKAAA